jgi:outer membrane protein OmpA-like peptidoglycan-associated protein
MRSAAFSRVHLLLVLALAGLTMALGSVGLAPRALAANECPAGWTFNSGSFTCTKTFTANETWTPAAGVSSVTYVVVGGGGGGAAWSNAAGGAGGEVRQGTASVSGAVTITVGQGGAAAASGQSSSMSGGASVTATGGSAGGRTGNPGTSSSLSGSSVTYGADGANGTQGSGGQAGTANLGRGGGGGYQLFQGQGCYWSRSPGLGTRGSQCGYDNILNDPAYNYSGEWVTYGAGAGGSGVVVLQYEIFSATSFTTSVTSPTNASTLTYSLAFNGNVDASSISDADFTNAGNAPGCVFTWSPTSGSSTSTLSVTVTGCSEGTVIPTFAAGGATSAAGVVGPPSSVAAASMTVDRTAPAAPSAPVITPTGGTVVANSLSATNTGLSMSSAITAGQATGGSAKFWLNGVLIGTDSSIGSGDTSVSITFGSSAAIQAAIAAGGSVTVELLDAAGNSVTGASTALAVDYTVPSATITPDPAQSTNTATSPMRFVLNMSEPISGLSASDFQNAGTATGCVFTPSATSGTSFEVVVTGCSAGTVQPRILAGSVTDGVNPGPTSDTSAASAVNFVTTPPSGTGAPSISALSPGTTTTLGSTLSATAGTWNDQGDTAATTAYQWQVCTSALASSCTDIVGQNGQTFVPNGTYDGAYIRAVTTRTNAAGTSSPQVSSLVGPMTRSAQAISFTGPSSQTFSTTPLVIAASSNRGLTVAFASTTPTICSVAGTSVTMLGAGTCTIQADQPGDSMYLAASAVTQSFSISRAAQTIAITTPTQAVAVGSTINLASSAPGTGAISYSVTSGGTYCSVVGNVLTSLGAGDCTVTSTIAQDAAYLTATSAPVTYSARISRTSTLDVPSGALLTDGTALVSASLSTGGAPGIYAGPPEVCRASGLTIILVGQGDCYVSTMSSADGTYMAADPQSKVFKVGGLPASPMINGVTLNGTTASVDFTPGGTGGATSVTDYTITATPVGGGTPITVRCTTSPCSVPGLTPGKAYDFTASANGLVGGKPVSSTPATYVPVNVAAPSTITILPPSKSDTGSGSFALNASSSLGGALPLSYTSLTPSVCTVSSAGQVTVVGPGTCSITAGHAGGMVNGVLYSPASQTISFEIPKKPGVSPKSPNVRPSGGGAGGASDNGQSQGSGRPSTTPFSSYVEVNGDGSAWAYANFKSPLKRPVIVEFVVLDASGQVVDRIKVRVPAGRDATKARISPFPPGGSVKVMVASDQEPRIRRAATITHASSSNLTSLAEANSLGSAMCEPVRFGPNSSELSSEAKASVKECARKLDRKGGVSTIAGYVRNGGGNVRDQLMLADQRARAVVDEFLRQGVRVDMRFGGVGAVTKEIGIPAHRRVAIHWSAQSA